MLIDVTRLLIRFMRGRLPTGVDRVCLAYIRRYGPSARVFLYRSGVATVLPYESSQELFSLLLEGGKLPRAAVRMLPSLILGPCSRSTDCCLFNVGHSGLDRRGYAEWLTRNRVKPIFMVHDLIPISHPEYCRSGESQRHTTRMRTVLRTAAAIITNSRSTLDALVSFANSSGLVMPPAAAAPIAGEIIPRKTFAISFPEPYFVMLGTIEPRKNHWMMLQVWRRLAEHLGKAAPKILIIGQQGWDCENVLNTLERCTLLDDIVIKLSDCSDAELAGYLRNATALIFPSFVEGFGLPLIEALSSGVPVIASNLPVFREIAGEIPDYLDPLDGTGWLACIMDYSRPDSPRRKAQLERMSQYVPVDWQSHFSVVDVLLEQVQSGNGGRIKGQTG